LVRLVQRPKRFPITPAAGVEDLRADLARSIHLAIRRDTGPVSSGSRDRMRRFSHHFSVFHSTEESACSATSSAMDQAKSRYGASWPDQKWKPRFRELAPFSACV